MKTHALKRGQTVELQIESLAPGGEGVGKDSGIPIFVSRVAPGDKVLVELFDVRRNFARGSLVRLLEGSPDRADPPCKLFKVCGGCQWQHMKYEAQLGAKKHLIQQSLEHLAKLSPDLVHNAIGSQKILFYRNKVQFPVRQPKNSKRILAGYFKQDSHELVNIKHCPIQPEEFDYALDLIKSTCEKYGITAYEEENHHGLLRFINLRISSATKKLLVTLILNSTIEKMPTRLNELAGELMEQIPNLSGVCLNFNSDRGNRIFGHETTCLIGEPYIEEVLRTNRTDFPSKLRDGVRFRLSPTSFFQVNTEQAEVLLQYVTELLGDHFAGEPNAQPSPNYDKYARLSALTAIDAYAGVGSIALWFAPFLKQVIAVEENPQAAEDGEFNVQLNGLSNVEFRTGRVEEVLPDLLQHGLRPDIIFVDPPRKGCAPETIDTILRLAPEVVIYVSCNPVTLARDLKLFESRSIEIDYSGRSDQVGRQFGYKTKQVLPIDLFPQTYHIESVTMLVKEMREWP
jgi:23S rRNA (uracil1939-C5)-methyltransferase